MALRVRIISPLTNPLSQAGEGASVGCARPTRSTMRGEACR
jgi:hypothetical protein